MLSSYRCIFSLLIVTLLVSASHAQTVPAKERICGKWENQDKTLRIRIYIENGEFVARIIWFSDTEGKPMDYWKDTKNPDPRLRNRTILGLNVLQGLKYDPDRGTWEDGTVYDSRHGREWNASATINKKGLLKVRGYWHFKWIGKTMTFHRIP